MHPPCHLAWLLLWRPGVRSGSIQGAIATALRTVFSWIGSRIAGLARWSLDASEEDLPPPPPPRPGPPHGPIPAIDLRREPRRGEVPRSAGPPP